MKHNNISTVDIMACVTRQRACERLIKRALSLKEDGQSIGVVHVARTGDDLLGNPIEGDALDILFTVAKANGAQMHMLRSDHVIETLIEFAVENDVKIIVLGESREYKGSIKGLVDRLTGELPEVEIHVVPA